MLSFPLSTASNAFGNKTSYLSPEGERVCAAKS